MSQHDIMQEAEIHGGHSDCHTRWDGMFTTPCTYLHSERTAESYCLLLVLVYV